MAPVRGPDQRHLRRVGDAAAYEDSNKDIIVAVELENRVPFGAAVFDPSDPELGEKLAALKVGDADWHVIPCRTERSDIRRAEVRGNFYFILHDWWSPLVSWTRDGNSPPIQRADIGSLDLVVRGKDGRELATADLTGLLRERRRQQLAERALEPEPAQPDAIFFSFEALDKFLFPQLASTYGVKGAWQMRNRLRRDIGDDTSDLRMADFDGEDLPG